MILFIHGFGSSGRSTKAGITKRFFTEERVYAPSLPYIPTLAIETLEDLIEICQKRGEEVYLIGSSLGGFYANYLSTKYGLKAVLINPSLNAPTRLKEAISKAMSYFDATKFEWNEAHIEMLKSYEVEHTNQQNILLMLQTGDEVLDYKDALKRLPNANKIVEEGGDHSFVGYENHLPKIANFFQMS